MKTIYVNKTGWEIAAYNGANGEWASPSMYKLDVPYHVWKALKLKYPKQVLDLPESKGITGVINDGRSVIARKVVACMLLEETWEGLHQLMRIKQCSPNRLVQIRKRGN